MGRKVGVSIVLGIRVARTLKISLYSKETAPYCCAERSSHYHSYMISLIVLVKILVLITVLIISIVFFMKSMWIWYSF